MSATIFQVGSAMTLVSSIACAAIGQTPTQPGAAATFKNASQTKGDGKTKSGENVPSLAAALMAAKTIDLSHPFDRTTIYWPTEKGFQFIRGPAGVTERGYYYAANRFAAAEHGGTHLDAPIHFAEGRQTAEKIPLERLIGEAVVVDVTDACKEDRDHLISVADLHRWEMRNKRKLVDVIVLLRTGWGRFWNNRLRYLGTDKRGPNAVADLHFPGLDPNAAKWLVEHRAVKAIGIDTASIDYGQSRLFGSHVALCGRNVPIFENVAHLDQLPETGAAVIALPMKIAGGSGGPLRIIAMLPE